MVESLQYDETLALGKKITKELNLNDSVDTLGRWMAHYIAELIDSIEKIESDCDKQRLKKECADMILKLWAHIGYVPRGLEPFKRYEVLLSQIDRITSSNIFERTMLPSPDKMDSATEKEKEWISMISVLNESFNKLASFCIESAIKEIDKPTINWSELSMDNLPYGQSLIQVERILLRDFYSSEESEEKLSQKRQMDLCKTIDDIREKLQIIEELI